MATILVTGGCGYIGSHTCLALLEAGFDVVVVDNLSNSSPIALQNVERLAGKTIVHYTLDLCDRQGLEMVFAQHTIEAVIHFAGLKAVGESLTIPLTYYHNNLTGTFELCRAMQRSKVRTLIFSSSATVYGEPDSVPITEDFPLKTTNPYGRTKLFIEEILRDLAKAEQDWNIVLLRYFNPVGAHPSAIIGEDPRDIPNNLFPYVSKVATGQLERLSIFGDNYPTPDGTAVRDYIHVQDLAQGHVRAMIALAGKRGVRVYNLGTGKGHSVLEVVHAFGEALGKPVPYHITDRRPGDVAVCYADPTLARQELGWVAEKGLQTMVVDALRWQQANPNGYQPVEKVRDLTENRSIGRLEVRHGTWSPGRASGEVVSGL